MDKEKVIKGLEKALIKIQHGSKPCCVVAEMLANEGYGNVKKAIKEFAEELKKKANEFDEWSLGTVEAIELKDLEELLKEFIGEEEL